MGCQQNDIYRGFIFDLDGTLIQSKEGILNSIKYALNKMNLKNPGALILDHFLGPPLNYSFQNLLGLSDTETLRAVTYYREYFREKGLYQFQIYPGIERLLRKLQRTGNIITVGTSKPTIFAEQILIYAKLCSYFNYCVGSNLDLTRITKSEIIGTIISRNTHIEHQEWIMIGDRKEDIEGAKVNQIASIGVGYGFGTVEELQNSHPTHYVDTVEELEKKLVIEYI